MKREKKFSFLFSPVHCSSYFTLYDDNEATLLRHTTCVDTRRYREMRTRYTVTRTWLVSRFSRARGDGKPGLDLARMRGGKRDRRRMSRLSQASLFSFSPSRYFSALDAPPVLYFSRLCCLLSALFASSECAPQWCPNTNTYLYSLLVK